MDSLKNETAPEMEEERLDIKHKQNVIDYLKLKEGARMKTRYC